MRSGTGLSREDWVGDGRDEGGWGWVTAGKGGSQSGVPETWTVTEVDVLGRRVGVRVESTVESFRKDPVGPVTTRVGVGRSESVLEQKKCRGGEDLFRV